MSGLSLWNIEQGLADLFERREELLSNPPPFGASADDPDETYDRQLMAVDLAIADYIKAEVQKVGNGGRRPVVITDEQLIPDEYRTVTVKMNAELWRKICAALPELAGMQECKKDPNLTAIYNALEQPCGPCKGVGAPWNNSGSPACEACDGSGKQGVPGAVLAPLGSHVRVK